jgi:hypothetical protein
MECRRTLTLAVNMSVYTSQHYTVVVVSNSAWRVLPSWSRHFTHACLYTCIFTVTSMRYFDVYIWWWECIELASKTIASW